MPVLIALPLVAYMLFFLAVGPGSGWRSAAVRAAILWGVATLAITEALGLFHLLTDAGLAEAWLLADVAAVLYLWRRAAPLPSLRILIADAQAGLDYLEAALIAGILCVLAGVAAAALLAPPNTTDAMVYHLPRIVHWLHNRNVAFYPTNEIRQLQMPPWAEYAMLQFHALSGGDRFNNLVQWFSLAAGVAGVSLIAEKLGAGKRGQALAAVLCATIPQGLLEASGAKNDWVTAFWLVALVCCLLDFRPEAGLRSAWPIGGALGLACLTKSVVFVMAPPLIAAAILLRSPVSWKSWVRGLAIAGLLAVVLNLPHFARNYRQFHSPFGPMAGLPPAGYRYTNERYGVRPLLSNVLRNLSLDAGTPIAALNRAVERSVVRTLAAIGEDANDPRTTWDYTEFHVPTLSLHEATAGNPLHAALIVMVCWILLAGRWRKLRPAAALAVGLIAAFVLFCAIFRWQPWHTRLHLPLFVLWATVIGTVLAQIWPRRATAALGLFLLLTTAPEIFANPLRSFTGTTWNLFRTPRQDLYFADLPELQAPYHEVVQWIESHGCTEIGLGLPQGAAEYPLDVLLHNLTGTRPIRNVLAGDRLAACLICPNCVLTLPGWPAVARRYSQVKQFDRVAVLAGLDAVSVNACSAQFTGWYAVEKEGGNWWRWSAGDGVIAVRASQPLHADLEAVLLSLRYPNRVEIVVNGQPVSQMEVIATDPMPLLWAPVDLRQGDNTVEFRSGNLPGQLPQDSRSLAIAVRNLAFRTDGPAACGVDPQ